MKKNIFLVFAALQIHWNFALATSPVNPDSLKPPERPRLEDCGRHDLQADREACTARNAQAENNYRIQLDAYNQTLALARNPSADTTPAVTTTVVQDSTRQLQDSYRRGSKASNTGKIIQMATMVTSMGYAAAAMACSASAPGCAPPKWKMSAIFAGISAVSGMFAGAAKNNANSACQSAIQLANGQISCSGTSTGGLTGTQTPEGEITSINDVFNPDGSCATDQETCNQVTDLAGGTNIRDALTNGAAAFASSGKEFTVNPDGSVTLKNGKTLKPGDFGNAQALIDAGFDPGMAASLSSDLNKMNAKVEALNAKDALAKENASSLPLDTAANVQNGLEGNKGAENGALDPLKDVKGTANANARALASESAEGLVKDFNGELIGAAGDDIFKMMNRRYNLKVAQDTFLAP